MNLEIIETGSKSAQANMDDDALWLSEIDENPHMILHYYEWENPSATYGYFVRPEEFFDITVLSKHPLDLGRRVTGGGVIFHLTDLAFSFLLPHQHPDFSTDTLKNYRLVNQIVKNAIELFQDKQESIELLSCEKSVCMTKYNRFCMAKPTIYDLMIDGKKVGGSAQRRTKQGLLHHGTISLTQPPWELISQVLKEGPEIVRQMQSVTHTLINEPCNSKKLKDYQNKMKACLTQAFMNYFEPSP